MQEQKEPAAIVGFEESAAISLKGGLLLFCLLLACSQVFAQGLRFTVLKQQIISNRLRTCPAKDIDRERELQTLFAESGCSGSNLTLQAPKHSKYGNVVCTLPGKSPDEILVGAHFDHVEAGAGAVDNWSGASLLPSLYESLSSAPRRHTFVFVGFYEEEEGEIGSGEYVQWLGKEKLKQIEAMVNMDTLGLGPTEVWLSHADKDLARRALIVANAMKLPLTAVNVEYVGSTDSENFRAKKVPSITFHSLTQSTLSILHSKRDQLSEIRESDYYNSYRLLAAYLTYLDESVQNRPQ